MNKELAQRIIHAVLVGLECALVIGIYAALTVAGIVQNPIYWSSFISIPLCFMFGGEWKDVPFHWINLLAGVFLGGWLTFFITQALVASIGLALAFAIATCVGTVIVQALTSIFIPGGLKPYWGRTPMAFVGMIAVFAAGGQNYLVLVTGLLIGVLTSTAMVQSGRLAAKIVSNGFEQR